MTTRVTVLIAIVAVGVGLAARGSTEARQRPALPERELATTVADGFTIASVGDTIVAYPQSANPEPGFQGVLKLLRDADVATANYEGNIIDGRVFQGTGPGGFAGTPDVAADMKAMGFDLVARSNNHAGEYGYEGLLETNSWLDKAGLVYAGSGEKYASARAARFVSTAKGRVGMVATASSYAGSDDGAARPGRVARPRRPERAALHPVLPGAARAVAVGEVHSRGVPERHRLLCADHRHGRLDHAARERFRLAPNATKPSYYSYQMNDTDRPRPRGGGHRGQDAIGLHDLRDSCAPVRRHQGRRARREPAPRPTTSTPTRASRTSCRCSPSRRSTPARTPLSARASTSSAASRSTRGGPIFYGLGEFFRQMDVVGLSGMGGRGRGDENSPPIKYESVVAISRFDRGQLSEVRLHPARAHRRRPDGAPRSAADRVAGRWRSGS